MQLTPIHSMSRVISMSHAIAYDSQAVAGASKQLKQGCRRALVKYLLHWTVGPDILRDIFTIWLITFTRNAFDVAKIGADLFVYICDVTFEIRARAERHVIGTRGKSRLNKSQTFIKQATPSKNIPTCWSTDVSYLCRTFISLEMTVCIWTSTFNHTAWSTSLSPRKADDAGLAQFDFTRSVSRKNCIRAFSWSGVEATAILATK